MANEQKFSEGMGFPVGSRIGKYEVREKLGYGGQSTVYKCYDSMLDRFVAIKQIAPNLAENPRFIERFYREAQILARLGTEQPAIVSIYELIKEPSGLFIVMEFIPGHTLETILQQSPVPAEPKAVLQIIWRLAAGLNAVHAAGIIHRDIKPANIIIGERLRVKITDFGVAASVTGQTSMLLGTTKYMAPELFEGQTVDARADLYSLGIIAYETLLGRTKFNEIFADQVRDPHSEPLRWMKWHGNPEVTAPPLNKVNPAIPQALSDIVARMMAKNPDDRFESMEHLGRVLRQTFSAASAEAAQKSPAAGQSGSSAPAASTPHADEADQLDIHYESPPTAKIPSNGLSLKAKIILLSVCMIGLMGIGMGLTWQLIRSHQQRTVSVESLYSQAETAYKAAAYDVAAEKYAQLQKAYSEPMTVQSVKASVMQPLAQARQAVLDRQWELAQSAEKQAGERLKEVQAKYGSLTEWTRKVADELANFSQHRVNIWMFTSAIHDTHAAMDAGDYREARNILERQVGSLELLQDQQQQIQSLKKTIDMEEFVADVEKYLNEGDDLAKQGKFRSALTSFQQVGTRLQSEKSAVLTPERRKRLSDRFALATQKAIQAQSVSEARTEQQAAQTSGNVAAELDALTRIIAVEPSPDDMKRADQLRAILALQKGQELLEQGQLESARELFNQAAELDPGNAQVKVQQQQLERVSEWQELVNQARAAEQRRDREGALKLYQQAAAFRNDPAVTIRISELRYEIQLAQADLLRDRSQFDEAAAAYEAARLLLPANSAQINQRLQELSVRRAYHAQLVLGDAAAEQSNWTDALKYYRLAKEVLSTDQIDQRMTNARYQDNLSKGKAAMQREEWRGAKAYFVVARKYLDTEEIRNLMAEVDQKIAGTP